MGKILLSKEERIPPTEFRSMEIGVTAVLGGLGFAFKAMGLVIPILGPFVVEPKDVCVILSGMLGGPIVCAIVGVVSSLASPWPFISWVFAIPIIIFGFIHRYFRRPWYHIADAGGYLFCWLWWIFILSPLAGISLEVAPFVTGLWLIYYPITLVLLEIFYRFSPMFRRYLK
jgi:hypothetical protein